MLNKRKHANFNLSVLRNEIDKYCKLSEKSINVIEDENAEWIDTFV